MQQGFVLATVLLFIMLFSLMTLSLLERSLLETRMSDALLRHYQQEAALTAGIEAGMKAILTKQTMIQCWQDKPLIPDVTQQNNAWWESSATCQGALAGITYRFLIEPVQDPQDCIQYLQVTSYLPHIQGQWLRAALLQVNREGLTKHTCMVRPDEEDFVAQLKAPLFLLSIHAISAFN